MDNIIFGVNPPLTQDEKSDIAIGIGFASIGFGLIGGGIASIIAHEYINNKDDIKYYLVSARKPLLF